MELAPYQNVQTPLNDPASGQGYATLDASRSRVAATSQEQHLEMELITAEGDRVTLSLESQSRALAVTYADMHAEPGRTAFSKGELFVGEEERSMTVTVEGDLNAQEKKDLGKVLKTLKKMMAHFVNDRLKPMLAKAKQLGKLETVAGLEVEMSYSRQVLVAEQTRVGTTYNQQGALESPVPTGPPAEPPSRPVDNRPAMQQEAEALTDAMAERMQQVQAFIEQMQGKIRAMFDAFREQVAAWNPDDPSGPDLIEQMHEDLMAKALAREIQPQDNEV
jgi:hypothetical protein